MQGGGEGRSLPRLSLPVLSTPRLSLTDTDRLLDAQKRSIEVEKLEKYILGKKSVELEIEFGIPRSQLCRYKSLHQQQVGALGTV